MPTKILIKKKTHKKWLVLSPVDVDRMKINEAIVLYCILA
jgi:hypothetical protein